MKTYGWLETIVEYIFPRNIKCIYCGQEIGKLNKYSLCDKCFNKVDFVSSYDKRCTKCNRPISIDSPYEKCRDCLQEYRSFDMVIPAVVYCDEMKTLLHSLKYHDKRYLSYYFAQMIGDMEIPICVYEFDYIVPVPSSSKKKRSRGYNQAELIGKYLENILGVSIRNDLLEKIDTGFDQNQLGKVDRKSNIQDSIVFNMEYEDELQDKNIILVDDIFTTGATVNECSKVLRRNGVRRVVVMVSAIASLE